MKRVEKTTNKLYPLRYKKHQLFEMKKKLNKPNSLGASKNSIDLMMIVKDNSHLFFLILLIIKVAENSINKMKTKEKKNNLKIIANFNDGKQIQTKYLKFENNIISLPKQNPKEFFLFFIFFLTFSANAKQNESFPVDFMSIAFGNALGVTHNTPWFNRRVIKIVNPKKRAGTKKK